LEAKGIYLKKSYTQSVKGKARRRLLSNAVDALTRNRLGSAIIRAGELYTVLKYAESYLRSHGVPICWRSELESQTKRFTQFLESRIGLREPRDLKLLYLCGPEPLNDMRILLDLGLLPENIWAIESNEDIYCAAIKQLIDSNLYVRIHKGNLRSFFDQVSEVFDIIYVDGCGPIFGSKPNVLLPILAVFSRERMADLSVLITTFAGVPKEKADSYSETMSCFFYPRYNDIPRPVWDDGYDPAFFSFKLILPFVKARRTEVYSDFVTRFVVDLGRNIVPAVKVVANPDVFKKFFKPKSKIKKIAPEPDRVDGWYLCPSSLPLHSFVQKAMKHSGPRDLLHNFMYYQVNQKPICEHINYSSLLENYVDGHKDVFSSEMLGAIKGGWFDFSGRYFCDIPFPHLIMQLLAATYGHPHHVNTQRSIRFRYKAKSTLMFCDAFFFDRCRYLFDYLPTIDLLPSRFRSIPYQLLIRACLDRLGWQDFNSSSRPFRGTALGGIGEHEFARPMVFDERIVLKE